MSISGRLVRESRARDCALSRRRLSRASSCREGVGLLVRGGARSMHVAAPLTCRLRVLCPRGDALPPVNSTLGRRPFARRTAGSWTGLRVLTPFFSTRTSGGCAEQPEAVVASRGVCLLGSTAREDRARSASQFHRAATGGWKTARCLHKAGDDANPDGAGYVAAPVSRQDRRHRSQAP